jgi:polyketide cyclase/dehydrase/lipid transport protein
MLIISIVAVALLAAVLLFAATKPDTFRIQRQTTITAAAEKVFALIDDFNNHLLWSPFEKDPAMKRTLSGAARGTGSVYEWDGNNKVGAGRIEITGTSPPTKAMAGTVTLALDMLRPFKAHNNVEFTIEPRGESTIVSWAMEGRQPFIGKLMSLFINCDKMVGKEFEAGLANLKSLAEKPSNEGARHAA